MSCVRVYLAIYLHFVDRPKYYLILARRAWATGITDIAAWIASRIRIIVPYSIEYKSIDSVPRIDLPLGETGGETGGETDGETGGETGVKVHWETRSAA